MTEEIKGTFTSSTTAKGIAHEVYPCDTGDAPWHANLGRFKPVHIKPKVPTCPVTGCLASNGVFIKVTGVDRTIKTIDDPSNVFDTSADPNNSATWMAVSKGSPTGPGRLSRRHPAGARSC